MPRFKPNRGFERELERQPRFEAGMRSRTGAVRVAVVEHAPVKTRHFRKSIRQLGNRVITTDIAGHIIEFGSINNPPYAPFRRAVRSLGMRFRDLGK